MTGPNNYTDGDTLHTQRVETLVQEEVTKSAVVRRGMALTPVANIILTGGSGTEIFEALALSGQFIQSVNPCGNTIIDTANLIVNLYLADVYSPEAERLLGKVKDNLVPDFRFLEFSQYPAAGDALKLRREFDRLMEEPAMREYITTASANAGYTILAGSGNSSAFYALATYLLDNRELYRNLLLVMVTPSRQVDDTDNPQRIPHISQRYEDLLRRMEQQRNPKDFGLLPINSELTVGQNVGDSNISPAMKDSAVVAADVIKRLMIDGSMRGGHNSVKQYDISNATAPLIGRVSIPSIIEPDPVAENTLEKFLAHPLAVGWKNPRTLDVFGPMPYGERWQQDFKQALQVRRMRGNLYNIDIPGNNLMGVITVNPEDATDMLNHLRP